MGNGMNKVLPGLYLGSFRDGKDTEQLKANNITHIVSIHDNARQVVEDKEYLCIRVPDSPDENLSRYFPTCNEFIHRARTTGGNVLIHCLAGVSRSATVAAAYIMSVTSLSSKDALKVVRGARNIANPNYGFQYQLKEFEFHTLNGERRRLKIKFPDVDREADDEVECHKMATCYHSQSKPSELQEHSRTPLLSSPRHRILRRSLPSQGSESRSLPCSPRRRPTSGTSSGTPPSSPRRS